MCSNAAPVTWQLLSSLDSGEQRAIFVLGSTQLFLRCMQAAQVIWLGSVLLQCAAETCEVSCVPILPHLLSQNKKKDKPY